MKAVHYEWRNGLVYCSVCGLPVDEEERRLAALDKPRGRTLRWWCEMCRHPAWAVLPAELASGGGEETTG